MAQGFQQGIYNISNAYERSVIGKQGDWTGKKDMFRVQGFEQVDLSGQPQVYDTGGMLTEVINLPWRKADNEIIDDQIHIQSSYNQLVLAHAFRVWCTVLSSRQLIFNSKMKAYLSLSLQHLPGGVSELKEDVKGSSLLEVCKKVISAFTSRRKEDE
ncbi:BEL1-like homeodomain protein 4 [Abeliophyllum distichum]|uniref:BEL1-like homeodomain protein 4 n=1 Tax=Abeliophyllum distichum TaxID=126358 RepID=A0ABD1URB7_9LAMI